MGDGQTTPVSLNGVCGLGDAELFFVDVPLGEGAAEDLKKKFSLSAQRAALQALPQMLLDGTLNIGDLGRHEIQIAGVRRVWTHRFWSEVQLSVLMPSKVPGGAPTKAAFAGIMVAHKFRPGVAALIVVNQDTIALTKMYRFHGAHTETLPGRGKGWRLECPRGGFKPGESPEAAAFREATEEAGISPSPSKPGGTILPLGEVEPDSGILMSMVGLFAITDVEIDPSKVQLDVTEAPTETIVLSVDEALDLIDTGEITCGITIAAITRALLKGVIRSTRFGGKQAV